ncbi:MAG: hypothetical protein GX974_06165 [Clostridiales bacterium]|nr:hypothetical protein [Clostridiales bacterium]
MKNEKDNRYQSRLQDESTDILFRAILSLENMEECYRFFEDICTVNEIKSLAQRLEVAKMLKEGRTYNEISEKTKASTATISRVGRFLNYGADGYKIILDRLYSKEMER